MASSIEHAAYKQTINALKSMASRGVFRAIGQDTIRGISQEAVVGRWRPKISQEKGSGSTGESQIPLPGIVVVYIGHNRPPSAGENDYDDGVITILTQVVDRLDYSNDNNIESYLRWQADVREYIQANPYRDLDSYNGDIYLTHVSDQVSAENQVYVYNEARLASQVSLFTRVRRDIGVRSYGR